MVGSPSNPRQAEGEEEWKSERVRERVSKREEKNRVKRS